MIDKEKENQINILIDELCSRNFSSKKNLNRWINKIKNIYSNNYRHSYSSISYKIQEIINTSKNSETLEILGENLNELEKKFNQMIEFEANNTELQKAATCFKKLSDHINLEIARYNFYKIQFNNKNNTVINNLYDSEDISEIRDNISSIEKNFEQIKLIANEAKKSSETISELENKVDVKLESNKISSITTLTIFSAVILSFSGGITFEAGIFKGMSESSIYRLIFTLALSGFILFNTIFVLLYLVGKLAGKSIGTKCKYMCNNSDFPKKCGDGYCQKQASSVNILCRLYHKYSYIFMVNLVLLLIIYYDYVFWTFQYRLNHSSIKLILIIFPLIIVLSFVIIYFLIQKYYMYMIKTKLKLNIVKKIIEPNKILSSLLNDLFEKYISSRLFKKSKTSDENTDGSEMIYFELSKNFKKIVEEKVKNGTKYDDKTIFKELNNFVDHEIIKNRLLCKSISFKEHLLNKKDFKYYKKTFFNKLSSELEKHTK